MAKLYTKQELLKFIDKINYEQQICIECGTVYDNEKDDCYCDNDE